MITVWKIDLKEPGAYTEPTIGLLTPAERARMASFRFESDRLRFSCARVTRRLILGEILNVDPAKLVFGESEHGKPFLVDPVASRLMFNSSHSGDWVLHAISDAEIGIDIEQIRPDQHRLDDLLWVLSERERATLSNTPKEEVAGRLARIWVRKEAYVKAIGEGLSRSLADISIVDGPEGQPVVEFDRNPGSTHSRWQLTDLAIADDYAACVASASPAGPITIRQMPGAGSIPGRT